MAACDWTGIATRLAASLPRSSLHPRVLAWLATRADGGGVWHLALSGGADSVCVLLLLWAHWPEHRRRLRALHFNHRLRAQASDEDALFCEDLCAGLGLPLLAGQWDAPPAHASEALARAARLGFLESALRHRRGRVLWTGHQADDVAESMFMRLARGSGSAGLSAPRPVQFLPGGRVNLRPLLGLSKEVLCSALHTAGGHWREDASNTSGQYLRNRIRKDVLPAWNRANEGRDALAGALLSRELLEEDEEALQSWLDASGALPGNAEVDLRRLAGLPRALVRRAVLRWLGETPYRGDLSRQGLELLIDACVAAQSTRFSLGRNGFALIRRGLLRFESQD